MPKKGRARRFREAREMKRGFDDELFGKDQGTLADAEEGKPSDEDSELGHDSPHDRDPDWDEEDPLKQ